jgi:hypothetical protein
MLVVNDDPSSKSFENLIIEVKPDITNAYLVEYTPSKDIEYNAEHDEYAFEGQLTSRMQIGLDPVTGLPVGMGSGSGGGGEPTGGGGGSGNYTGCVSVLLCNANLTGGIGDIHYAGPRCSRTYSSLECNWSPSGSGSSTGSGNPNYGGGTSGTGNTTPTPPVVTSPVVPPPPPPTKPCLELKKLTDNTNIRNIYKGPDGLESKVNEPIEYGFSFSRGANYDSQTAVPNNPDKPNELDLSHAVGGNFYGASHTHPLSGYGFYPMFPMDDILYLYKVSKKYNNNGLPKDYSIFVLTMTIPSGTFAIKITDATALYSLMGNKEKYNKVMKEIKKEYYSIGTSDVENLTKALLKIMSENNMGISLYQARPDFSEWDELSLPKSDQNNDKPVEKNPCSQSSQI